MSTLSAETEGLTAIEAEFHTEHFVIRGSITSPEMRLSDHLNSSTTTLELEPESVYRTVGRLRVSVERSTAYITKSHLLFALPISESPMPTAESTQRLRTVSQMCWAGIGQYSLVGKLHMEAGRNPRLFLRSLEERQFLPFTDVRLTLPDGAEQTFATVLVNRLHLELLALAEKT